MRLHPLGTYLYVWSCDLIALLILILAIATMPSYPVETWLHFGIWVALMCVARLGVFELLDSKIYVGVATAFEFAAMLVLPPPLYFVTILLSTCIIIGKRILNKHPEPFLGPDFNASNLLISSSMAYLIYTTIQNWLPLSSLAPTIALLPTALVFIGLQNLLLTILLSIDLQQPWKKVGIWDTDTLLSDGLMILVGALLGRIYHLDPLLLALMVLPLLLLHKTLKRMNQAKLAYIDGKTGLYNYRYLDEKLNELFDKASDSRPLSLIFGDMDHLRDINNTYGHPTGDRALIAVAQSFSCIKHPNTTAARFGGEEFVLLLSECTKEQATEIAEQLRSSVANSNILLENGDPLHVTISLGVATYPEDAKSVEELVKAADDAVYIAKHSGRNRVCVFNKLDNVHDFQDIF